MLSVKTFTGGGLHSNGYLVYDKEALLGVVVDMGTPYGPIAAFCEEKGISITALILTHGHYDHIAYIDQYLGALPGAEYIAHEDEVKVITDRVANVSDLFGDPKSFPKPKKTVGEGDKIAVGGGALRVLSTPGHTPGSICLYAEDEGFMLTGDTLFVGNRGRTDFKYGDDKKIQESLIRLFSMDKDIFILPGHGGGASIERSFFGGY